MIQLTGVYRLAVKCDGCGKDGTAVALNGSGNAVAEMPVGWIVFDQFPPGDSGLGWACSPDCYAKWAAAQ